MKTHKIPLLYFAITIFLFGCSVAESSNLNLREPVISQCTKENLCSCQDIGGDVYDEGFTVRCVFYNKGKSYVYDYFRKHHKAELARLLPEKPPSNSGKLTKESDEKSESIEINYEVDASRNILTIRVDYMNGGYAYIFTPKGKDFNLDFVYYSYN